MISMGCIIKKNVRAIQWTLFRRLTDLNIYLAKHRGEHVLKKTFRFDSIEFYLNLISCHLSQISTLNPLRSARGILLTRTFTYCVCVYICTLRKYSPQNSTMSLMNSNNLSRLNTKSS